MTTVKRMWSREELSLVTRAFLEGKSIAEAQILVPDIKLISIKQKYSNCVSLNMTKLHQDVWNELKTALAVPDVDEESSEYDAWGDKKQEEDGENYFKCSGVCDRVMYYEETDGEGMCGNCQLAQQKKGKKK